MGVTRDVSACLYGLVSASACVHDFEIENVCVYGGRGTGYRSSPNC